VAEYVDVAPLSSAQRRRALQCRSGCGSGPARSRRDNDSFFDFLNRLAGGSFSPGGLARLAVSAFQGSRFATSLLGAPGRARWQGAEGARTEALRVEQMIVVDTNTWINHLRTRDSRLVSFLSQQRVRTCDVVVGELLLGSGLPKTFASDLAALPHLPSPSAGDPATGS
jgi:hypothetical protein